MSTGLSHGRARLLPLRSRAAGWWCVSSQPRKPTVSLLSARAQAPARIMVRAHAQARKQYAQEVCHTVPFALSALVVRPQPRLCPSTPSPTVFLLFSQSFHPQVARVPPNATLPHHTLDSRPSGFRHARGGAVGAAHCARGGLRGVETGGGGRVRERGHPRSPPGWTMHIDDTT